MAPRSTFVPAGADGRVYAPSCPFVPPTRAAGVPNVEDPVAAAANTPFSTLPTMTAIGPEGTAGLCRGRVVERFWLRPRATFDHIGPIYEGGTEVVAIARPLGADGRPMRRGSLTLYEVRAFRPVASGWAVGHGYAALSHDDLLSCLGELGRLATVMLPRGKSMNDKDLA